MFNFSLAGIVTHKPSEVIMCDYYQQFTTFREIMI